jgi:DNA-binding PadR family transcriptional regulator
MSKRLGMFELVVLLAILRLRQDAYGMRIRQDLEERTGQKVSIGAVYSTLDRLKAKGYVTSWLGDPIPVRGGKAKQYFQVTGIGEIALQQSQSTFASLQEAWASLAPQPSRS